MRTLMKALVPLTLAVIVLYPGTAHADVPNPTVEGPVTAGLHGRPWFSSLIDLTPYGYTEEEFFFSGDAEGLPYKTRIVVRRPIDPADFSGTVFVEWVNVTGGRDLETLWPAGHSTILDERHAYVVVSAQLVGHSELRAWDPVRYGSLVHPGDTPGSFRIFEQAIQAIRYPKKVVPLGPLNAEFVIATGDSQSAGRLTTYIEDRYAIKGLIDGFLPGRGGGSKKTGKVAGKLHVPMLWILEESQDERPADTRWQKFWYQAGAAHAPFDWSHYVWRSDMRDLGQNAAVPDATNAGCSINRGVGYAVRAGVHWMNLWVRGLDRPAARPAEFVPPSAPRLKRDQEGELVRNDDGHAIGGIRYPYIEAPIAVNTSEGCPLFGSYEPFTSAEILGHYPKRQNYISAVKKSADAAAKAGFLLPLDRELIMNQAKTFDVWSPGTALCYDLRQPIERIYYNSSLRPCP